MVRPGIAKKRTSYNTDVVLVGPGGIDEWERFREC